MKFICSLSMRIMVFSIFILASCSPVKDSVGQPTDAINNIRKSLELPETPLEFVGNTTMANSPSGGLAVANYRDSDGRVYSVDLKISRVVEIDARAMLANISSDAPSLTEDEIKAKAITYAKTIIPDFDSLQTSLQYEAGGKVDNYFFTWYGETSSGSMNRPFLQFSFHKNGILFAYYNTLSVEHLQTSIISSQPADTLEASMPLPTDVQNTIAEVEELAGFDVKEPTYLPTGVSFDYATYQNSPGPKVTLHFKLVHETFGDMGAFFQIVQEPQAEASPNPTACGDSGNECEVLEIGDMVVKYRLSAPTEFLMWDTDGFSFQLLRTAGEPNKIYKDELLKVVGSLK